MHLITGIMFNRNIYFQNTHCMIIQNATMKVFPDRELLPYININTTSNFMLYILKEQWSWLFFLGISLFQHLKHILVYSTSRDICTIRRMLFLANAQHNCETRKSTRWIHPRPIHSRKSLLESHFYFAERNNLCCRVYWRFEVRFCVAAGCAGLCVRVRLLV